VSELYIRKSIDVEAPAATLWRVLTESAFIEKYMFGCYADTDWKPGSQLLWKGATDNKLYVKGHCRRRRVAASPCVYGDRPKLADSRHSRELPDDEL
jgi:uncharacterized protein YndB with AHSA1/START domain